VTAVVSEEMLVKRLRRIEGQVTIGIIVLRVKKSRTEKKLASSPQ